MAKHPSEVFCYPVWVSSQEAKENRTKYWCNFVSQRCDKQSRLISYPMGVCSVQYNSSTVAICPKRFLQDNIIFKDIARHYFGTLNDLVVFPEAGLAGIGSFDYVMVKHKPLSSEIEDFVIIEMQTDQTTGTGKLVKALEDFMQGKNIEGETYGFGTNTYDTLKRSFTQILNKGIVLENWQQKIYWVFQEFVYRNFTNRYNLKNMGFDPAHSTVFMIYDLKRQADCYQLTNTRIESSTIENLFNAFRNNPNIPSKDKFVDALNKKLKAQIQLNLKLI